MRHNNEQDCETCKLNVSQFWWYMAPVRQGVVYIAHTVERMSFVTQITHLPSRFNRTCKNNRVDPVYFRELTTLIECNSPILERSFSLMVKTNSEFPRKTPTPFLTFRELSVWNSLLIYLYRNCRIILTFL